MSHHQPYYSSQKVGYDPGAHYGSSHVGYDYGPAAMAIGGPWPTPQTSGEGSPAYLQGFALGTTTSKGSDTPGPSQDRALATLTDPDARAGFLAARAIEYAKTKAAAGSTYGKLSAWLDRPTLESHPSIKNKHVAIVVGVGAVAGLAWYGSANHWF